MEHSDEGRHWAHAPCVKWMYFICQMPGQTTEEVPLSKVIDFIGPKRCLETEKAAREVTVEDEHCYHIVKMQYTRETAKEFCQDKLGGSLARVQGAQRATFERLLYGQTGLNERPVNLILDIQ